jgi:hypothetical protein
VSRDPSADTAAVVTHADRVHFQQALSAELTDKYFIIALLKEVYNMYYDSCHLSVILLL